jgi:peptidyl-tRNA hydrolase ICT1
MSLLSRLRLPRPPSILLHAPTLPPPPLRSALAPAALPAPLLLRALSASPAAPPHPGAPARIPVPRDRVRTSFSRSSGAGGQNVNVVATKAELRFRLDEADWLPDDVRLRLAEHNARCVTREGEFLLTSQVHRTQARNLEEAFAKLQAMVDAAAVAPKERELRTDLTDHAKQQRVRQKKARSDVKARRRGSDE